MFSFCFRKKQKLLSSRKFRQGFVNHLIWLFLSNVALFVFMTSNELFYALALTRAEGIGDVFAKKLLERFGSAENVFSATKKDFTDVSRLSKVAVKAILSKASFKTAERELSFIEKQNINVYYFGNEDYPNKLKHCADAPILLFAKGNFDLNNRKILSIVGTRKITSYGTDFCKKLIEGLAQINPVVISGFALGTDICAHLSAIENGLQTVGVLAHGFDRIYPPSHAKHVRRVEENGGFLTEFWSGSVPDKENFVKRNRIVAGISDATIVIESALKGGSLITANLANDYAREVFAVPGKTTDTYSQGCNNLIKTQRANILTDAEDILYMLNWDLTPKNKKNIQKQLFVELNPEEQKVYDYLYKKGKDLLDLIAKGSEIPVYKTASILFDLEMKGVVRPLPGKMFELA